MSQNNVSVSLTDLCAICHVNPIKYTCPRDGTHTCSLPCVKRHKQWAQCSGVRDPAEYRKRSELATPASIDKDFNFITSVERSLSRADDAVADRGIDLQPARLSRPNDPRPKFELEVEARGIKIIKAPKGLSRSTQNKTYRGGQPKCIIWTVEWLCQDGSRSLSAAPEIKSIRELFDVATHTKRHNRKRKRSANSGDTQSKSKVQDSAKTHTEESVLLDKASVPGIEDKSTKFTRTDAGPQTVLREDPAPEPSHSNQYFYLHRPLTESRFKCLIPISSGSSLLEVLNNKTLVEFPTIYVRDEPPEHLSKPFIAEDKYVSQHGTDIPITVSIPATGASAETDLEDGEVVEAGMLPDIDESKVLEVLKKDLGS